MPATALSGRVRRVNPYIWRIGSYWHVLTDPPPNMWLHHSPGSLCYGKCWRCGGGAGVALPCNITDACAMMSALTKVHKRCKPTLLGARWELIQTLRIRRGQLERANPPPESSGDEGKRR